MDEHDNTLTDLEKFKDPNLFQLSRRIRKLSRRMSATERQLRSEIPTLAKQQAIVTLRKELDELKRANQRLRNRLWTTGAAILIIVVKWALEQLHK